MLVMPQQQSPDPLDMQEVPDNPLPQLPIISPGPNPARKWWVIGAIFVLILLIAVGVTWWLATNNAKEPKTSNSTTDESNSTSSETTQSSVEGLKLDVAKNYGDKYANGLLPVGDNKYTTDGAKKGYVYMCNANFVPSSQAGAQTRGPWFTNNNTQWDINKKVAVKGNVMWQQNITVKIENGKRVVTTNDLPDHHTGVFPVASSDPAYSYDRNPNSISTQSLIYSLTASPTYGSPQCMTGEVGVMLTGIALFNGFDAGGRDAGAWEVQDSCDGHPQSHGEYHYHTLSRCITDVGVGTVIGFALDGFPITGPKVGDKNYLTTDDLDECHGTVSEITLDGKKTTMYHYVMTQDFPYSASCFRATAIKPPGQSETTGGTSQQTQQGGQQNSGGQMPPPPGGQKPY